GPLRGSREWSARALGAPTAPREAARGDRTRVAVLRSSFARRQAPRAAPMGRRLDRPRALDGRVRRGEAGVRPCAEPPPLPLPPSATTSPVSDTTVPEAPTCVPHPRAASA